MTTSAEPGALLGLQRFPVCMEVKKEYGIRDEERGVVWEFGLQHFKRMLAFRLRSHRGL